MQRHRHQQIALMAALPPAMRQENGERIRQHAHARVLEGVNRLTKGVNVRRERKRTMQGAHRHLQARNRCERSPTRDRRDARGTKPCPAVAAGHAARRKQRPQREAEQSSRFGLEPFRYRHGTLSLLARQGVDLPPVLAYPSIDERPMPGASRGGRQPLGVGRVAIAGKVGALHQGPMACGQGTSHLSASAREGHQFGSDQGDWSAGDSGEAWPL